MPQVGDTVWVWDENRRIYSKSERGAPIWREHWRPMEIVSETSRSWVCGRGFGEIKVPKKGADPRRFAFTQAEIDEQAWVHENRYRIERMVGLLTDAATLRAVEKVVEGMRK